LYALLKRYAQAEQNGGWSGPIADQGWLVGLGAERDVVGSAHANAWLHALGEELPEEIILLPLEQPKRLLVAEHRASDWPDGPVLEAFPNPSRGPIFLVYEVPEGIAKAELRVVDLSGREVRILSIPKGSGLIEFQTAEWAAGIYLAELRIDGVSAGQAKVIVQH